MIVPGLRAQPPRSRTSAPTAREVSQTITHVRGYDRKTRKSSISRTSAGSEPHQPVPGADRFVVLSVTFGLAVQARSFPVRYAELAAASASRRGDQVESIQARSAVIELRQRKRMVIDPADPDTRSVGSFFVNPVLTNATACVEAARVSAGWIPGCPGSRWAGTEPGTGEPEVRGAADRAGRVRQATAGDGARIYPAPLALVNSGSASTASLMALAREIRHGVRDTFGVCLAPRAGPGGRRARQRAVGRPGKPSALVPPLSGTKALASSRSAQEVPGVSVASSTKTARWNVLTASPRRLAGNRSCPACGPRSGTGRGGSTSRRRRRR